MSRCDAKKFKMEGEKMKNVKKLRIMVLVAIFATTSLAFSCQAGTSGLANQSLQLQIRAPLQVAEHFVFKVTVSVGNIPLAGAVVTVSWLATSFTTDSSGTLVLTSPWVDHDTQFMIFASKQGFLPTKTTITVINLPIP
jgi:hypothetical protein